MATAKDIVLKPIDSRSANKVVKRLHYSGKVVQNSQLHLGVFLHDRLEGVMQFGPSLDKRKIQGLVDGTLWHEFIELNRMAFSERLPRNSESRAIAVAMKLLRKHAPQVKWVISFADATQCGDGTIYRASGFVLTGIKQNDQIWEAPDGVKIPRLVATNNNPGSGREALLAYAATFSDSVYKTSGATMRPFIEAGYKPIDGFQLRYIYFIDPSYRARLTVPELPYSAIDEMGARMYKGEKIDAPPVNGDNLATSQVGRFDPDPEA